MKKTFCIILLAIAGCSLPPTGKISLVSISPAPGSRINTLTPFNASLKYNIDNFDPAISYSLNYRLYDPANNWYRTGKLADIKTASGSLDLNFTGTIFYSCFQSACFAATQLPFRLSFGISAPFYPDFAVTSESNFIE